MKKLLTDTLIRSLPIPASGRTEATDTRVQGLTIRVTTSGARSWSFRFRDPRSRRVTRATLGVYPDLGLADAREKAIDMRRGLAKGFNPVEEKRREREEASTRTFEHLAARYIKEHAERFKKDALPDQRALDIHVLPKWRTRPFDQIRRRDVIELCEGIVAAGKPIQANRVQALLSKVFAFAVDKDMLAGHPFPRLGKLAEEQRATRTLSDAEIAFFWRRIIESPVSRRGGLALRLVLLSGVRVTELAGAEIREFERLDEPAKAVWTIPAIRSKNGRAHVVPLVPMAVEIVRELMTMAKAHAGRAETRLLLASPTRDDAAIDGHALSVNMTRFGNQFEDEQARLDEAEQKVARTWFADRPTAHDLRRTLATRLASLGIPAEDVSACLNHTRRDVTGRHYDQYDRMPEKRRALALWATEIGGIVNGAPTTNVVPLKATG